MSITPMFSSILTTSLSGLKDGQARLFASATNIANAATEGYKKIDVVSTTTHGGGVDTQLVTDDSPGPVITDLHGNTTELSNVDVTEELVGMILAKRQVEANAIAIAIQDDVLGTIVDLAA